jgi:hypothetical protein
VSGWTPAPGFVPCPACSPAFTEKGTCIVCGQNRDDRQNYVTLDVAERFLACLAMARLGVRCTRIRYDGTVANEGLECGAHFIFDDRGKLICGFCRLGPEGA